MPADFAFPDRDTEFWIPLQLSQENLEDRNDNYLKVVARLHDGATIEQADTEIALLQEQVAAQHPELVDSSARAVGIRSDISWQSRTLVVGLVAAAACVLLIACTNLASLLLARGVARRRELAVRTAMGAGRERLIRQLLTESLVLALLGGGLGVLLALAAAPSVARLMPSRLPVEPAGIIDLRVLGFSAVLTLLAGLGFGVFPALRSLRSPTDTQSPRSWISRWRSLLPASTSSAEDATQVLAGTRAELSQQRDPLRRLLVVAEVAIAVTLLVCSGLLLEALRRVQATDPGFLSEEVLTLETALPRSTPITERIAFLDRVVDEVEALPGVEHAAYISFLPMDMGGGVWPVELPGDSSKESPQRASLRFVTPGFFDSLGIPLHTGRDVERTDLDEPPFVAVVSQSFAERYWPGENPIGRRFGFAFREREIVGVAGDIRVRGLEQQSEPQVYLPYRQVPDGALTFYAPKNLVVRTSLDAEALTPSVREVIRRADPELPVTRVRRLDQVVLEQTASRRDQIRLLSAFTAVALLLAGLGIHGLLSFSVSQRTSEIGLRLALGAQRRQILGMVLRESASLAGIGLLAGVGLSFMAGRAMQSILAGVPPAHTLTLLLAVVLAAVVTVTGTVAPALRALRCEPTLALRAD